MANRLLVICLLLVVLGCDKEKLLDIQPAKTIDLGATNRESVALQLPIAVSQNGTIAIGCYGEVHVIVPKAETTSKFLTNVQGQVEYISITKDGKRLGLNSSNELIIFDLDKSKEIARHIIKTRGFHHSLYLRSDLPIAYFTTTTHSKSDIMGWHYEQDKVHTAFALRDSKTFPNYTESKGISKLFGMLNDDTLLPFPGDPKGYIVYNQKDKTDRFFDLTQRPRYMAVSKDQNLLAITPTETTTIVIVEVTSGKIKTRCESDPMLPGPAPCEVRFTSDGKHLVVASTLGNVRPSYFSIYQVSDGKCLGSVQVSDRIVTSLNITPDDKYIVTADRDGAKFWDLPRILTLLSSK
jgi:WD40 repeat protein